jgi:hypothetical protein
MGSSCTISLMRAAKSLAHHQSGLYLCWKPEAGGYVGVELTCLKSVQNFPGCLPFD